MHLEFTELIAWSHVRGAAPVAACGKMEKDRLEVDSLVQDFAEIDRLAARILEDRQQVK